MSTNILIVWAKTRKTNLLLHAVVAKGGSALLMHGAKGQITVLWDLSSIYWPLLVTFIDKKKGFF